MGCFCHKTLDTLTPLLPRLHVPASERRVLGKQGSAVAALFREQAQRGRGQPQPAVPQQPRVTAVPTMQLSMAAIGTIAALADFRASVQEQFGIDLLAAGQAMAMARIVVTLNARLSALASQSPDTSAWVRLAALNSAVDHVRTTSGAGTAVARSAHASTSESEAAKLAGPAVLAAAAVRLKVDFSANVSAQLAAALRTLRAVALPALAEPRLVATLTAALAAVAQLRQSLGLDPLTIGFAMVAQVVSTRLDAASKQARAAGRGGVPQQIASQDAPPVSVETRQQMTALAAINWQVPPITALPAITIGLPVCTLTAQLKAALGIDAVRLAPCGAGCDAAKLARALA
ncbi:MAG: hypothetical protein JO047_01175 [Alphaproteobacteria bacterium]|nr:hypothetical protein [Alphaproteobacteria bacterium]